jgi:hypothetical protein
METISRVWTYRRVWTYGYWLVGVEGAPAGPQRLLRNVTARGDSMHFRDGDVVIPLDKRKTQSRDRGPVRYLSSPNMRSPKLRVKEKSGKHLRFAGPM